MVTDIVRKTPLYEKHLEAKGKIIDFAGWYMPVRYSSSIQEHLFVRNNVGMFDLSHMGEIIVRGKQAIDLLQYVTCNDIGLLVDGQIQYNVILNENGGLVDDVTIYRVNPTEYFVVSNAANYEKVTAHLQRYQQEKNFTACEVIDQSDDWALIAIQGPKANDFMIKHFRPQVNEIAYYHFADFEQGDEMIRVSRTGYTGEDGFEVYTSAKIANELWQEFIQLSDEIMPIGLAARDSLRMEVFYPLYGHELNQTLTPVECNLKWIVKDKKSDYLAKKKILLQKADGAKKRVVGFRLPARAIAREGYPVLNPEGNKEIGRVLSGLYSPSLERGIGSALIPIEYAKKNEVIKIKMRDEKLIEAQVHFGAFVVGGIAAKKKNKKN